MATFEKIDWSGCSLIEVVKGKQSGAPVLRSTRIPADILVDHSNHGASAAEIAELLATPLAEVKAVLAYAKKQRATAKQYTPKPRGITKNISPQKRSKGQSL